MRTKNTVRNMIVGLATYFLSTIANFVLKTVFIMKLGETYLGINGLMQSILSMLAVAELGIGTAIGFSLYKPVGEGNVEKVKSLMKYYKTTYRMIGMIILALGIVIMPFLPFLVKEMNDIPHFYLYYVLYLSTTVYSYFITYKRTLISVDQKGYITSIYDTAFCIISDILRIIALFVYPNFIVYLIVYFGTTLVQNLVVNARINKEYPFLLENDAKPLDKEEKKKITKNIGGLLYHRIGGYLVGGTDNIIMSKYISLAAVGLYSNYTMIMTVAGRIMGSIINSATASFGNLIAMEKERAYGVFKKYNFIGFWVYGFMCLALFFLLNPFITIWLGEKYLIDTFIVFVVIFNLYLTSMLSMLDNIKSTAGIYYQDRYIPLIQAAVNLVVSVVGVKLWGLLGVFVGTIASTILVLLWARPYFVYKYVFEESMFKYFRKFFEYLVVVFIEGFIIYFIFDKVKFDGKILYFIFQMFVVVLVPNLINLIIYRNTKEYKESKETIINIISKKKSK